MDDLSSISSLSDESAAACGKTAQLAKADAGGFHAWSSASDAASSESGPNVSDEEAANTKLLSQKIQPCS
jgi:hypothetical protein